MKKLQPVAHLVRRDATSLARSGTEATFWPPLASAARGVPARHTGEENEGHVC